MSNPISNVKDVKANRNGEPELEVDENFDAGLEQPILELDPIERIVKTSGPFRTTGKKRYDNQVLIEAQSPRSGTISSFPLA
jgi:hypothetical protein